MFAEFSVGELYKVVGSGLTDEAWQIGPQKFSHVTSQVGNHAVPEALSDRGVMEFLAAGVMFEKRTPATVGIKTELFVFCVEEVHPDIRVARGTEVVCETFERLIDRVGPRVRQVTSEDAQQRSEATDGDADFVQVFDVFAVDGALDMGEEGLVLAGQQSAGCLHLMGVGCDERRRCRGGVGGSWFEDDVEGQDRPPEIGFLVGARDVERKVGRVDVNGAGVAVESNVGDDGILDVSPVESVGDAQQCAETESAGWVRQSGDEGIGLCCAPVAGMEQDDRGGITALAVAQTGDLMFEGDRGAGGWMMCGVGGVSHIVQVGGGLEDDPVGIGEPETLTDSVEQPQGERRDVLGVYGFIVELVAQAADGE